jgi:predicted mannosyl-3-phosphoglycerate phosphatase (HAD superfamily)
MFSRLRCEYIVDMFSRWQEERLNYHKRALSDRAASLVDEERRHEQTEEDDGDDDKFDYELPASFMGSRKYQSENCADALALA